MFYDRCSSIIVISCYLLKKDLYIYGVLWGGWEDRLMRTMNAIKSAAINDKDGGLQVDKEDRLVNEMSRSLTNTIASLIMCTYVWLV